MSEYVIGNCTKTWSVRKCVFISSLLAYALQAKFLNEVQKDYLKAAEYFGRAVLVNPNDGNVLTMYAELVWTIRKDSARAESYFSRAVAVLLMTAMYNLHMRMFL